MLDSGIKYKNHIPTCSICKNEFDSYYRIPRVIPKCGHTFCEKCINNSLQVKANRKVFICTNCECQTVIRKGTAEDIPKNIGILDITKNLKKKQYEQSSPMSHKNISFESPLKKRQFCSEHLNKQLDLICETCKYLKVCSICVLMGKNHENHKFVEYIPASKVDLNEVNEIFMIIEDSVKETILPNSKYNILKKVEETIINSLTETVKQHFRENYYRQIEKKQAQIISQCKQIKLQTSSSYKIQEIAKIYDLLKTQHNEILQLNSKVSLSIIEQFIQRCKNLHNQIEQFSEHTDRESKRMVTEISHKLCQSSYFKITEIPFSLKVLISGGIDKKQLKSPERMKILDSRSVHETRNNNNKKIVNDFDAKTTSFSNNEDDVKSIKEKSIKNHNLLIKSKSPNLPPKNPVNSKRQIKVQQSKQQISSQLIFIPTLQLNSKQPEQKLPIKIARTSTSNTERITKSSVENININIIPANNPTKSHISEKKSPHKNHLSSQQYLNNELNRSSINHHSNLNIAEDSQLKIKQVRPSKQIPLNLKAKYTAMVSEVNRQTGNQSLELIGMQINDNLIVYLCEYLRSKKIKFLMIKLVKNLITDEGMSVLLGYLVNDDVTQVLNLTSNQLSSKCIDLVIELGGKNRFLKTIYLLNNKVTNMSVKAKKKQLQSAGIDVII